MQDAESDYQKVRSFSFPLPNKYAQGNNQMFVFLSGNKFVYIYVTGVNWVEILGSELFSTAWDGVKTASVTLLYWAGAHTNHLW